MKKACIFTLLVVAVLMSGCDDSSHDKIADDNVNMLSAPYDVVYSDAPDVDDGIIQATRYDEEITIIRCGDNYFTYSVNMYGIWFLDEVEIVLPDDYEQQMGTAVKLVADTESSSGGITGKSVCYIKEIKQQTLLCFDDEWAASIPVWGERYPGDWDHLSKYGFDEYDSIAVVYKYAEDGGVYTVGNTTDELVVCCDGVEIGRYDQCRILTDPQGYGTQERIVLCKNDIDDRAVWQLVEDGIRSNDSYFLIGDIT